MGPADVSRTLGSSLISRPADKKNGHSGKKGVQNNQSVGASHDVKEHAVSVDEGRVFSSRAHGFRGLHKALWLRS